MTLSPSLDIARLLAWYVDAGVDETIADGPVDHYAPPPPAGSQTPRAGEGATGEGAMTAGEGAMTASHGVPEPLAGVTGAAAGGRGHDRAAARPGSLALADSPPEATRTAAVTAAACQNLEELARAVAAFEGCPLKTTAATTVFADGVATGPVMVIGEAPGAEEDRQGRPFVGASGQLLDRMLASVGLDRRINTYITNVVPWRPPGNRKPTPAEVGVLMPFLERHIALVDPTVLLLTGALASSSVLARKDGIIRLRGQWFTYSAGLARPIPVLATFHPAYLLRSPSNKRLAWRDLLTLKQKLDTLS